MNSLKLAGALLLMSAATTMAQDHDAHAAHQHGNESAQTSTPAVPGKRYATDATLRSGMAKIRQAVANLEHHEMGHLDVKQVAEIAGGIETQVQDLIANCKLEPEADQALHGIIGALLASAKTLREHPEDAAPVAKLRDALAAYPNSFDDPTFKPLTK